MSDQQKTEIVRQLTDIAESFALVRAAFGRACEQIEYMQTAHGASHQPGTETAAQLYQFVGVMNVVLQRLCANEATVCTLLHQLETGSRSEVRKDTWSWIAELQQQANAMLQVAVVLKLKVPSAPNLVLKA